MARLGGGVLALLFVLPAAAQEPAPGAAPPPAPAAATEPAPAAAPEPAPAAAAGPAAVTPAPAPEPVKAEPPKDPDYREGLGFAGLPLVNFNSDEGLGYGLRLAVYDYGKNLKPYRYALIGQFFQTTNLVMVHKIIFDAPHFLETRWRIDGELKLNADKFSPWYGWGNRSEYVPEYTECADRKALETDPDVCAGNPEFRGLRYNVYESFTPNLILNVRGDLEGPWKAFAGYRFRVTVLNTDYPKDLGQTTDSKLEEDLKSGAVPPVTTALKLNAAGTGFEPRRNAELLAGIVYDSRDNEPSPTQGMFHDFSLLGAGPILGGEFWYAGVTAVLRFFQHLDDEKRFVLAFRAMFDAKVGDVPFYMLPNSGGLKDPTNFGGGDTIRGVLKNRLLGKIKLLANAELRWTFLTVRPFGQRLDLGLVGALDAGRVWKDWVDDGFFPEFKVGGNIGLRIALNENFLIRVDYARALNDPSSGLYITFDNLF